MLSGAHLASAARLAPWLDPSPVRALSSSQTGKLLVFAGLAALAGGILLLLRQWPQVDADLTLTTRFAWLLLPGGGLVVVLDLAQVFGLDQPRLAPTEEVVKWAVFGGCGALIGWRLLSERGGRPPDRGD